MTRFHFTNPHGEALTPERIRWSEAIHTAMFRMIQLMRERPPVHFAPEDWKSIDHARAQVQAEFPDLASVKGAIESAEHAARCLSWHGERPRLIARGACNWDYFAIGERVFSVPNCPSCKASLFGDWKYYRQHLSRHEDAYFGPWPAAPFTGYAEA